MKWAEVVEALEFEIEEHELDLKEIATESARRHALVNPWWKEDGRTYDEELGCTVDYHKEQIEAMRIAIELVKFQISTNVQLVANGVKK
jgi:hypothetical protein